MDGRGMNFLDYLEFKDEYRYKEPVTLMFNSAEFTICADLILTIEKDRAKLYQNTKWGMDLLVIGIQKGSEQYRKFKSLFNSRLKKK